MKTKHIVILLGAAFLIWLIYAYKQEKAHQEKLQAFIMKQFEERQEAHAKRQQDFDERFKKAWSRFDRPVKKDLSL